MKQQFDIYSLTRNFFDWSYENPEKINPNHVAMYFFIIEHCNRLGWKEKFGLPTLMTMEAIGIKNYKTFAKTFSDLIEWGLIKLVQKSKNQYSSNIIALVIFTKAHTKALTKASIKQSRKQVQSIVDINKQDTIILNTLIQEDISFETFWNLYNKKVDKAKVIKAWNKVPEKLHEQIYSHVKEYIKSTPDVNFRKNPLTYLNAKAWENEIYSPEKNESVPRWLS